MNSRADKLGRRLLKSWETAKSILEVRSSGVGKAFVLELLGAVSTHDDVVRIAPLGETAWSFFLEISLDDAGFDSVISPDSDSKTEREAASKFGASLTLVLKSGDEFFFRERRAAGGA